MFIDRLSDPIGWLIKKVRSVGFEGVFKRYYGVYRGIVIDNNDSENRGRVRVLIPSIGHTEEGDVQEEVWALPCSTGLSVGDSEEMHGVFFTPDIGDQLFIMFEKGITSNPIYIGGWVHNGTKNMGRFSNVERKGIKTKKGHTIELDDEGGILISKGEGGNVTSTMISLGSNNEVVISTNSGTQMYLSAKEASIFSQDGSLITVGEKSVTMINSSGTNLSLNDNDVSINASQNVTISCGGKITLKGAVDIGHGPYEQAVTGDSFVTNVWTGHTHGVVSLGSPTSPPVIPPPAPANGLSTTVRISK